MAPSQPSLAKRPAASRASPSEREFRMTNGPDWLGFGCDPSRGENVLQLSSADHGVHFRNVFLNLVAIALDQAAGDDQAFGLCRRS